MFTISFVCMERFKGYPCSKGLPQRNLSTNIIVLYTYLTAEYKEK